MPRLRLFGPARQAAGTGAADAAGETVAEVLGWATDRYGEPFGALLDRCGIWVNGEPSDPDRRVGDDDEVAVIPPLSGG